MEEKQKIESLNKNSDAKTFVENNVHLEILRKWPSEGENMMAKCDKSYFQRLSLPEPILPKTVGDEQFKISNSTSMQVVRASISCLITERLWLLCQPSEKDVTRNGDITAHVVTSPLMLVNTAQSPAHSSSSMVFTAPAKSRTFRRIVQSAGVTFLILSIIMGVVLLAIPPPQHHRYRTANKSTNISYNLNLSPGFSGVSTKFTAPATYLQIKKQDLSKNNTSNVFR